MTNLPINTTKVYVSQPDCEVEAYLAKPKDPGIYPGVVVLQEIFGINEHIQDVTERIAKLGYVAIAPALFQRQHPGFATGYTPEAMEIGRKYAWSDCTASQLLSDIQATINYLKTMPEVKAGGFGCIGFCFGGHVAYLAATLSDIRATASFYGARITTATPGGGSPTITRTKDITGTIYAFFGDKDPSIPPTQIDEIARELEKHHISHRVFRYNEADHGFFCNARASYNHKAADDAWKQVQQLFTSTIIS